MDLAMLVMDMAAAISIDTGHMASIDKTYSSVKTLAHFCFAG